MNTNCKFMSKALVLFLAGILLLSGCAGGSLTTREKEAGIGALGGAAAGGPIGAAVGGGLGLGAGALIGDQLQGQENENYRQDQQIQRNQQDIERQQSEINRLKRQSEY